MAKYLDYPGLSYFWNKVKAWIRNYAHASYDDTTGRTTVVVDNITFDVSHKLPANYTPSTLENEALNPAANDSYDLAISKIHKAIKDNERVTAESLTDLDTRVDELDELKAPKESPTLTGVPTAPTATAGTSTTLIATTEFVQAAVTSGTSNVTVDGILGSTINRYGVCSTAATTAAKTVNITTGTFPTLDASATGTRITVKFTNANTASTPTLNVNSKGAKGIYYKGTLITDDSSVLQGICDFIYDNANGWNLLENLDNTTGATIDSSKLFIVGAKSLTNAPVTYSLTNVYMLNGKLYSGGKEVSTTDSITAADDLLDGSHAGDNTVKYAPYTTKGAGHLYSGTTNPTNTNRLNYDGAFYATNFNGKTLGQGNSSLTTSDIDKIPSSAEVASFVDTKITEAQVGAAMFQGIIKSGTTLTELPSTGYKKGWYWIVGTAGTYAGIVCEAGDTIFCVKDYVSGSAGDSDFNVIQTNIETISTADIDGLSGIPLSS